MIYLQQVEWCYVLPLRCFASTGGRKLVGADQVDPSAVPGRSSAGTTPEVVPMVLCGPRGTL